MIVSIASGKGGTGKTLIATNLALALAPQNNVQLLDCDVEEPNDHIFMKPVFEKKESAVIPVPIIDETKCTHCGKCSEVCVYNALAVLKTMVMTFHELCHGCGACSYLCPEKAIREEPREIGAIEVGQAGGVDFVSPQPVAKIPSARTTIGSTLTSRLVLMTSPSCCARPLPRPSLILLGFRPLSRRGRVFCCGFRRAGERR